MQQNLRTSPFHSSPVYKFILPKTQLHQKIRPKNWDIANRSYKTAKLKFETTVFD